MATETEITDTTGILASGVKSITFNNSPVVREIDVFGFGSVVPEPSTYAMLVGGIGLLALTLRLRKRSSV